MKIGLDIAGAVFAFLAAGFWWRSAMVKIPGPPAYLDYMPDDAPFNVAMRKAATLSRWAAIFTGLSAVFLAVSSVVSDFNI